MEMFSRRKGQQMADRAEEPKLASVTMQGYWPPSGTYVTWEGGCGWATEEATAIVQRWSQAIRLLDPAIVGFSVIEGGMGEPFLTHVRADHITSVADRSQEFEQQKRRRAEFEAERTAVQDAAAELDVRVASYDGP